MSEDPSGTPLTAPLPPTPPPFEVNKTLTTPREKTNGSGDLDRTDDLKKYRSKPLLSNGTRERDSSTDLILGTHETRIKSREKDKQRTVSRELDRPKKVYRTKRTWQHNIFRIAALYLAPALLSLPISLILYLTRLLLQPIYNSLPLNLHGGACFAIWTFISALFIWNPSRKGTPRKRISARLCTSIAALGGDLVAISGRRFGSISGRYAGAEWGAFGAAVMLGLTVVGGGSGFALLCYDYIYPVGTEKGPQQQLISCLQMLGKTAFFMGHVWLAEKGWIYCLDGSTGWLVQKPERSILLLSLLLTSTCLFLTSPSTNTSFAKDLHRTIRKSLKLDRQSSKSLWRILSKLPRQTFPILLLLRIPLLIIALRQQIFLRPSPPYLAVNNSLRVLSSERGITGQIVVAEDIQRGFRFLRCDASILGGRWMRRSQDKAGNMRVDLGDSIFATFPLQEVAVLAARNGDSDTIARTVESSSGLRVAAPRSEDENSDISKRALIIGLGVGISAQSFSHQRYDIDIVEIDPLVHQAAIDHFDLKLTNETTTVNLIDGNQYISELADMRRSGEYTGQKWSLVVQDCFSGGGVPEQLFTREFWMDLKENTDIDGIVAMNFVGLMYSKAAKAVLVTLLSEFEQCRAFSDALEKYRDLDESVNMVVFCTQAYSPLLSFRPPKQSDVRRSPLRSHVYSTFLQNEIRLYDILQPEDFKKEEFMLRRDINRMQGDGWGKKETSLSVWRAMQKIMPPEMWMVY